MSPLRSLYAALLLAFALPACAGEDFQALPDHGNHFTYVNYGARWPTGLIRWQYNPSGQPANLSSAQILASIQAAMSNWNLGCGVRFEYLGTTSAGVVNKDGKSVIGWGDAKGFSGYTNFWWDGNQQISEGDIVLNAASLTDGSSLQAIVTHELGHLLGLTHSDQPRSIMFANPYHTGAYQTLPKGDDYAACALLYGSAGVASYSDLGSLPTVASTGSVSFAITTSAPTASRPASSLSDLPSSLGGKVYFTAYFNNLPVGDTLTLRLVTPDGYPYYEYALTNKYSGSAYLYTVTDFSGEPAMRRLPGDWQVQLLDQNQLLGRQSFSVAGNYPAPAVPSLALLATSNADGSTNLTAQTLSAGESPGQISWLLDQRVLGNGSALTTSPGAGVHSLWLLANSGNSRYSGGSSGSSAQDNGPDNGLFLATLSGSPPASASFGAVASGTRAAFSLDGQVQIAASGSQQIFVATVLAGTVYFKVANGWSATPQALLSADGPGWVAVNLFKRDDIRPFPSGLPIYLGYGSNLADLLAKQTVAQVYTLP